MGDGRGGGGAARRSDAAALVQARLGKMKTAEELAIERAQLAQFNANVAGGAQALTTKRAIKHHETKAKTRPKANRVTPSLQDSV